MSNIWEYKIISIEVKGFFNRGAPSEELNKQFNLLSNDGWEFVESQRIDTNEWTDKLLFIFKRLKG